MEVQKQIEGSETAEMAAVIGRRFERDHASLLRPDWNESRIEVMREALMVKFQTHATPQSLLLSTDRPIVENSPHDFFWGCGIDGSGENHLGELLMSIRDAMLLQQAEHKRACHDTHHS